MGCAASTKQSNNSIHPPSKISKENEEGDNVQKKSPNAKKLGYQLRNKKKNKSMMNTNRNEKGIEVEEEEELMDKNDRKSKKRVEASKSGKKKPLRFNSTKMKGKGSGARDRCVDKLFPEPKRIPSEVSLSNLSEPSQLRDLEMIEDGASVYKISGKKGHYQKIKKGMRKKPKRRRE